MSDHLPEGWRETLKRSLDEAEAVRCFCTAEEVAYLKSRKNDDLVIELKVRFAGFGRWEWNARQQRRYGQMRSGVDETRAGAMLAAYNAAKELADGE